jgi:hypothetical protein
LGVRQTESGHRKLLSELESSFRQNGNPDSQQALERFPFERNRSNDKKSLKIKMLEQALIEKVYQLFRSLL